MHVRSLPMATKTRIRERWRTIAAETMQICETGSYTDPNGFDVDIRERIHESREQTREWTPRDPLPPPLKMVTPRSTRFQVVLESTLAVSECLYDDEKEPLALNFASATNAGGGFQNGSLAQEESIAYASALYAAIRERKMYTAHRKGREPPYLYGDYTILSPKVPVFRRETGTLLAKELGWECSFLTSPAPNANQHLLHSIDKEEAEQEVKTALRRRMNRVLTIAHRTGYRHLVLGAWGCGAFGCNPKMVAELFFEALTGAHNGSFRNHFSEVIFAIRESSFDHPTVQPFVERFGNLTP